MEKLFQSQNARYPTKKCNTVEEQTNYSRYYASEPIIDQSINLNQSGLKIGQGEDLSTSCFDEAARSAEEQQICFEAEEERVDGNANRFDEAARTVEERQESNEEAQECSQEGGKANNLQRFDETARTVEEQESNSENLQESSKIESSPNFIGEGIDREPEDCRHE